MNNIQASKKNIIINSEHEQVTNGSIRVTPNKCVIHFKPGHTYMQTIQLLNITDLPQIIKIKPLECKLFKFPYITTVSILPNGSWNLQFTFMTYLNQEFKSYLHLKNPTGQGNFAIELRAIPKMHSCLPKILDFGNVDIGMSVTRKLSLAPKSKPYQFRIFIPFGFEGLCVDPTCGEVLCDYPKNVTVVYTPQSYITLCIDLVLYLTGFNQKPHVITLTAVTKPKPFCHKNIKMDITIPKKKYLHSFHKTPHSDKTENDIIAFNRLTLNTILKNKGSVLDVESYKWLNPLGELDKVYRDAYLQNYKDFMVNVKCFSDKQNKKRFDILRNELNTNEEQQKSVFDKQKTKWKMYIEKLNPYENILLDDQIEPLGLRERSIRINHIDTSDFDFDPNFDDNWFIRFQLYNKFINAVKIIIIKNRLEKRLNIFKALIANNIINML
ncbi:cilia- and flagella-associated protein 221-like [Rhopalosiphum maidis]|uniref:cilia- and flagella-associated protein 221-like n=1 Tax=Rhopalosiphum maidis TaxID=43146 RepID=UPI000EFEAEAC|nr:cilia- and flagella-associated protein 221-like [Rhopalosiphum maidis]